MVAGSPALEEYVDAVVKDTASTALVTAALAIKDSDGAAHHLTRG
jgi:hypothetical protein